MARFDDMVSPLGIDDDDSDDEVGGSAAQHKAKPRRKSHQRPQGSDQVRQAFSKRKKGLVLKAYQLNALTDAKVFMFIVNDKGTSWAYATPGFSNSLNPDLLKQLRALAHVPEQAKLITEVMPDPPNVKHPAYTAGASEHASVRRGDQAPGFEAPCTRTATGAIPARSRSSYSGGGSGRDGTPAGASCDRVPLARSGSTTATRMQSIMQSDEHSPTKPRARPLSGSSMAGGARPGSAMMHTQYLHQQRQGGKLLGMEPPTPCGMYNLLGQPVAANDSPTIVSDLATSCPSPSSKQSILPPDVAAGARLAAAINSAAACGVPLTISQGGEPQDCWQQQATDVQWLTPQQHQQQQGGCSWQMSAYQQQQQQYQEQQQQLTAPTAGGAVDGWIQVEVNAQPCYAAAAAGAGNVGRDCQQQLLRMCSATNTVMQQGQQQQHMLSSSAPSSYGPLGAAAAVGTQHCFDTMLRGLPPLRVSCQQQQQSADWREPDGAHSAPAGALNPSSLGRPSQWMEFEVKPEVTRQLSDVVCYASSSGYSSYGASPSYINQQQQQQQLQQPSRTNASSPVGDQAVAAGCGPSGVDGSLLLPRDAASADPSPTAALSNQLCCVLAVESPLHPTVQQQRMESYFVDQARDAAQQHQQQQHNQGAYMPRTDDLVSDPLMDMLMDQAIGGGRTGSNSSSRPGTAFGQQQQQGQQHISIMEATLQQRLPKQEPQQYYDQMSPQQFSQQQQQQQQQQAPCSAPMPIRQAQQQEQLSQVSSLLQHIPLPPKSDAEKPAWQEHVRQLLSSLQLQPQQHQQLMTLLKARTQDGMSCSGSNPCSPVLPPSGSNMAAAAAAMQQQHQQMAPGSSSSMAYGNRISAGAALQHLSGKQRLGPSRLSATSPAIDASAAGMLTGMDCSGMQNMQCVVGSYMQQDDLSRNTSVQYVAAPGSMPMSTHMGVQGMQCAVPVSMGMGTVTSANYCMQAVSGGLATEGSYSYSAQMMPMPMSMAMTVPTNMQPTEIPQQQQQQLLGEAPAATNAAANTYAPAAPACSDPGGAALQRQGSVAAPVGGLLAELQQTRSACSSPLKRNNPSGPFGAAADLAEPDDAMSPLKRACRDLPEPPSFAMLLQTELGEDDAVAWAASAAANDSLKAASTLGSCGSFLKFNSLSKLESGSGSLPAFVTVSGSEAVAAKMAAAGGSVGAMLQQLEQEGCAQPEQGQGLREDTVMGELGNMSETAVSTADGAAVANATTDGIVRDTCGAAAAAGWDDIGNTSAGES